MKTFTIPSREDVSENNKLIFDTLKKNVGFVPNMYAFLAHSSSALGDYLTLQNRNTSLNNKEKEVVNLVVSQLNGSNYCQTAHTAIGKMVGFTEDQTIKIRKGKIYFNAKLEALARLTAEVVNKKGEVSEEVKSDFFNAGYTIENLIDVVMTVGDKIISNYLFAFVKVPIDFPIPKAI